MADRGHRSFEMPSMSSLYIPFGFNALLHGHADRRAHVRAVRPLHSIRELQRQRVVAGRQADLTARFPVIEVDVLFVHGDCDAFGYAFAIDEKVMMPHVLRDSASRDRLHFDALRAEDHLKGAFDRRMVEGLDEVGACPLVARVGRTGKQANRQREGGQNCAQLHYRSLQLDPNRVAFIFCAVAARVNRTAWGASARACATLDLIRTTLRSSSSCLIAWDTADWRCRM